MFLIILQIFLKQPKVFAKSMSYSNCNEYKVLLLSLDKYSSIKHLVVRDPFSIVSMNIISSNSFLKYGYTNKKIFATVLGDKGFCCYLELKSPQLSKLRYNDDLGNIYYTGASFPFNTRRVDNPNFIVPVSNKTWITLNSMSAMTFPIKISSLGDADKLMYLVGIFFGFLIIIFTLITYLSWSVRNVSIFTYGIYVFFLFIFFVDKHGFAAQFIWPNSVWWKERSVRFFGLAVQLVHNHFILLALKPEKNIAYFQCFISMVTILVIFIVLLCAPNISHIAVSLNTFISAIICFGIPFYTFFSSHKREIKTASRYLIFSGLVNMVAITIYVMYVNNFLSPSLYFEYSINISSLFEVSLLLIWSQHKFTDLSNELSLKKEKIENMRGISHDLISPFTYMELFLNRFDDTDFLDHFDIKEYILNQKTSLMGNIQKSKNLVRNICSTRDDLINLSLKKTNLYNFLLEIVNRYIPHCIGIDLACDRDLSWYFDPLKIESVISNIIQNALDATNGQTEINVSARLEGFRLNIEILNYGSSISKTDIDSIFNKHFSKRSNGNGLGLYNAKRFVVQHKGQIFCTSNDCLNIFDSNISYLSDKYVKFFFYLSNISNGDSF